MNLLSIKGGGVRGLISLKLLIEIENITGKAIYELFDYFGGSSVGSLIVSGLLISSDGFKAKYTAQQLYDLFINNINNSFTWTYYSYISSGFGLFGPSYTTSGLTHTIHSLCGDYMLGNLLKPFIFPAYDRIDQQAYYFDKDKNKNEFLLDVMLGCSAAPTYFKSHKMIINDKNYDFADSALVANNNSQLVLLKATQNENLLDRTKILLLSLGTGIFPHQNLSKRDGVLNWLPNIIDTILSASEENESFSLSLYLPKDNYYIMDVPLDKVYHLDDTRQKTIDYYISQTDKWINDNKTAITLFCDKLMINKKLIKNILYNSCKNEYY